MPHFPRRLALAGLLFLAAFAAWALPASAVAGPPDGEQPELVQPVLTNAVTLEYPPELLERPDPPGGTVVVKFVVGVDGVPKELEVIEAVDPILDDLAIDAVGKLRYEAATYGGQPVEVVLSLGLEIEPPVVEPEPDTETGIDTGADSGTGTTETGTAAQGDAESGDGDPETDAGPVRISGILREAGVRNGIEGATVLAVPPPEGVKPGRIRKQIYEEPSEPAWTVRAITQEDGSFELRGVPDGLVRVIFLTQGYERLEYVIELEPNEAFDAKFYQERLSTNPYRTTVESERDEPEEVTRRSITAEEITSIPGTQGDALKAIQNFPGVARPPFGAGLLVIRGAAPEDSATFLAYHEIPQLFHFGGLTSVFNSDILQQIDFIPGNFDGRYGDAIGGVINVVPRKGKRDGYHGYIDSDLFDTGVLFEGPVGKGSFILSGRRSYIDLLLPAVIPDDAGLNFVSAPRYWDYQAIFDYPIDGGEFTARVFGSDDRTSIVLSNANDDEIDDRNAFEQTIYFHRVDLAYRKKLGKWDVLFTPSYQNQFFDIAAVSIFDFNLTTNRFTVRAEANRRLSKRSAIRIGTQFDRNWFKINVRAPALPPGGDGSIIRQTADGLNMVPAVYSTLTLGLGEKFTLYPGLRLTGYTGQFNTVGVDPRLRASFAVTDTTTLKAGYGLYSQAPQPVEQSELFGNPDLRLEYAMHTSLGIEQLLPYDISIEATGFHKYVWDLVVNSPNLKVEEDGDIVPLRFENSGVGRIYGLEFLARKALTKNFFGWISYTLMRSETKARPGEDFVLFGFDQTHILTLIGSIKLPYNWQVGARFRLVSGNPTTPIDTGYFNSETGNWQSIPGPENSTRDTGFFHQLDFRVDKYWTYRLTRFNLYVDIQNIYNRQNVEFINYSYNFQQSTTINSLPIIPSVGLKIEF